MKTASSREAKTDDGEEEAHQQLSDEYVSFLRDLSCSWSGHRAAKRLTPELIEYIRPRIHRCSTPLKVRILTSLLYLPTALLSSCSRSLCYLLNSCETDRDDWVRKLSRLLLPYVSSGQLDLREIDTETAYRIIKYLDEQSALADQPYRLKPAREHTKIHDVTIDSDLRSIASVGAGVTSLAAQPSAGSIASLFANLPQLPPEAVNFHASVDLMKITCGIEMQGIQALTREMRLFETQQEQRRRKAVQPPY